MSFVFFKMNVIVTQFFKNHLSPYFDTLTIKIEEDSTSYRIFEVSSSLRMLIELNTHKLEFLQEAWYIRKQGRSSILISNFLNISASATIYNSHRPFEQLKIMSLPLSEVKLITRCLLWLPFLLHNHKKQSFESPESHLETCRQWS